MDQLDGSERKPLAESIKSIAYEARERAGTIGENLREGAKSSAVTVAHTASPLVKAGKRITRERGNEERKKADDVRQARAELQAILDSEIVD